MATKKKETEISIVEIKKEKATFCVLGKTPFICESMNFKTMQELLFPPKKKNTAEKQSTLKHNPYDEFRRSPYVLPDGPTVIAHLAVAFKRAICAVGSDVPGTSKAQMGRLIRVTGEKIPLYGIPTIKLDWVRSSGINGAPDVRTRACLKEWACYVNVEYSVPIIKLAEITKLFSNAGDFNGVGGWRQQKGSADFGCFELVSEDNKDFQRIVKNGDRGAQTEAMERPEPYDQESEDLLMFWLEQLKERGFDEVYERVKKEMSA